MTNGNPFLTKDLASASSISNAVTLNGVITKTVASLAIFLIPFIYVWIGFLNKTLILTGGQLMGLALSGLVLGLVIIFGKCANIVTVGLYSALQGAILGSLSVFFEEKYPGIVMQTSLIVVGAFSSILFLYTSRIVNATPGVLKFISVGAITILGIYLIDILARAFGHELPLLNSNSGWGIAISVGIVLFATFTFIMDFANIEAAVANRTDKKYEWYLAFGLLIGLLWLYIEVLRLLVKLRSK